MFNQVSFEYDDWLLIYLLFEGTVLFIDNWRVMHGRAAYRGSRTMAGCYVGQDSYTSKARHLGVLK